MADIYRTNQPNLGTPDFPFNNVHISGAVIVDGVPLDVPSPVFVAISSQVSLPAAVASIGASHKILIIDQDTTITDPIVIPATLQLQFIGESRIIDGGGGSLDFEGVGLTDPEVPTPIFEGFAPGDVVWSGSNYPHIVTTEMLYTGDVSFCKRLKFVDAAFVGKPVTFMAYPRTFTEGSILTQYHTLDFTAGNYLNTMNTWGTTYYEPLAIQSDTVVTSSTGGATMYQSSADARTSWLISAHHISHHPGNNWYGYQENMVIEKMRFKGVFASDPSGGNAAIPMGNAHKSVVRNCVFDGVTAYGIFFVGLGDQGNYALDSGVHDCIFKDCKGQVAGILNGQNCFVRNNTFHITDYLAGGNIVDCEPNQYGDRLVNIVIEGNLFDCRAITNSAGAITVQSSGADNIQGIAIRNNTILGREVSSNTDPNQSKFVSAITIVGVSVLDISNNLMVGMNSAPGMKISAVRDGVVQGNTILGSRDASGLSIGMDLGGCTNVVVKNNTVEHTSIPWDETAGIYEYDERYKGHSTGSVVTVPFVGGYPRLRSFFYGLTAYWNGAEYTIDTVFTGAIGDDDQTATMTSSVGTVAVKTFADSDITTGTDTIAITVHGYNTGCIVRVSSAGTIPPDLDRSAQSPVMFPVGNFNDFYVIKVNDDSLKLASSLENALANTPVDITNAGTGTHTLTPVMELRASNNTYQHNIVRDPITLSPTGTSRIIGDGETLGTPLKPAQITSNQNNYALGGRNTWIKVNSDAARDITGFASTWGHTTVPQEGELHRITNTGSFTITLKHESASSTATNRIHVAGDADHSLTAGSSVEIMYDKDLGRWRIG